MKCQNDQMQYFNRFLPGPETMPTKQVKLYREANKMKMKMKKKARYIFIE